MRSQKHKRHPLEGLILGAISGLAGTVAMTQFQNIWNKISEKTKKPGTEDKSKHGAEKKEDSTMKAAGKISEEIGHPLSAEERKKAGPWVHYAFGTSVGAVFGLATEMEPDSVQGINPALAGAAYGAAVFLAAHEIAVPALKLSSNPLKEPIPDQIAEFASHLIYGIGTALTYDAIKRLRR
jgi:putative membrane protein